MSKVGVHLIVEGRVQGVGFRYFSQRAGLANNITGYVRNLPDGNVEIEAVGENQKIIKFINSIRNDHPYARVLNIQQNEIPVTEKYKSFQITY